MQAVRNWPPLLMLMIPGTLWGVSFLVTELILETIPPITAVFLRNSIAGTALIILLVARGGRLPRLGRAWIPFLFVGFFDNALPTMLINSAQVHIDSGLATIYTSTTPFFTLILASIFIRSEKITFGKALGVTLGLIGVVLLIGPAALSWNETPLLPQLAVLAASSCFSIAAIYSRIFLNAEDGQGGHSVLEWMTGQIICSALLALPVMLVREDVMAIRPSPLSLGMLLFLSLVVTLVAFFFFYLLISTAGPTYATFVTYLIPINGLIWGSLILSEEILPNAYVAVVIIFAGIAVMNGFFRPTAA